MLRILFSLLFISTLISCRDKNELEIDSEILNSVLDTINFNCRDIVTRSYFKGTLKSQALCYGNYTENSKTGDYFGFTQVFGIRRGAVLNTAKNIGDYIEFGFDRDIEVAKDQVFHSFRMDTPNFLKDSTKTYAYYLDSLLNVGNLTIRNFKTRDVYEDYQVYINLYVRRDYGGISQFELSTAHGYQNSFNYIKCIEKIKLAEGKYSMKFDINCELYTNLGLKYYGNLTGELVTIVQVQ
jgi:hypothetical protein